MEIEVYVKAREQEKPMRMWVCKARCEQKEESDAESKEDLWSTTRDREEIGNM